MTNVTRTTSATIVSALSAVQATTGAVAKIIDTAASSIDMLDEYVQRAKRNQHDENLVADKHWRRNLLLDAAREQEKKENEIAREYANDHVRQQRFNSILSDLESLFQAPTA